MAVKTLILLAPGYEELEAVAIIDILRRASIEILIVGTVNDAIPSARGVKIIPDTDLESIKDQLFDMIILPGGIEGTENISNDQRAVSMLKRHIDQGKMVGAICAAPTIFDRHGISEGKTITCHPVCRSSVKHSVISDKRVIKDGQIITSQGPGTAIEFALEIVRHIAGEEKMLEVNKGVMAKI